MALLRGLVVIHTTSKASNAQTDALFRLNLTDSSTSVPESTLGFGNIAAEAYQHRNTQR
jgi:hypothetical protein